MENYLRTDGRFYHITDASNAWRINSVGLIKNNKGICLIRTNRVPILNTLINTQLQRIEEGQEFILVSIEPPLSLSAY